MRTLAIGDIHGCATAFDALLARVRPRLEDLVVTLGDYVDRGPDSKGVIQRLIDLQSRCRLVALKGNHDLMMLDARGDPERYHTWFHCGGKQTLRSYGADLHWDFFQESVPPVHWEFLEACVSYHETDTHFFVHANAYAEIPLDEQPDLMLHWEKLEPSQWRPHESGKTMVCGHSAQREGAPLVLDRAVCLDTWVYGAGWLSCLDVKTGRYWQANEGGETREAWLE
jgi:serine/threonine protein phosphatase 1